MSDTKMAVLNEAREVLQTEAEGILQLIKQIDANFVAMVDMIDASSGRLIVSGIGKSGIIGRKIVATLNSTGTRSLFLHPVEAMHGDLGQVVPDDIFLALSNSGETDELNILVPSIRSIGCRVIAFTGGLGSSLAQNADIVINVGVPREACAIGLAPTASSTAMLAMGDALAVVMSNKRHFSTSDFRKIHPGGNLGQRLTSRVDRIMISGEAVPVVSAGTAMGEAIQVIDQSGLGTTLVVGKQNRLLGIITDGDIRRMLVNGIDMATAPVEDVMTPRPKTLNLSALASEALYLMEKFQITSLPVVDGHNRVRGILHLHDILGKGEFKFNGGGGSG